MWIFCPGHEGVGGNKLADRLARHAEIQGRLRLDKEGIAKVVLDRLSDDEEKE